MRNPKNLIFRFSAIVNCLKSRVSETLKILKIKTADLVRGSTTDYENFLRALRKRNGGWQGYLAEIMDVTQVRSLQTQ